MFQVRTLRKDCRLLDVKSLRPVAMSMAPGRISLTISGARDGSCAGGGPAGAVVVCCSSGYLRWTPRMSVEHARHAHLTVTVKVVVASLQYGMMRMPSRTSTRARHTLRGWIHPSRRG